MNPDGISYLDMASEAARTGPASLVNGDWSPLYPALLGLTIRLFHPSPEHEFAFVHAVNWVIFAGVLVCFVFFLQAWFATRRAETMDWGERHLLPVAFVLFLTATTQMIPSP
jgi:hypothetical protein